MIYYFRTNRPNSFSNINGWIENQPINIVKLEDLFIDIGDFEETHIVKVTSSSSDLCSIGQSGYTSKKFKIMSIIPINEAVIKNYLILGAIPTLALISYCMNNQYLDVLLYIADKCPEFLYRFVNRLISESMYTDIIEKIVISGYNIHKDNDTMFLFAAASKNYRLCKFLLENGSNIPRQVVNMYSVTDKYKDIKNLIDGYKDRIID